MEFYNVKKRASVVVADTKCAKEVIKRETSKGIQYRYAVSAKDDDGTKLYKFISEATFKGSKIKEKKK